MKIIGLQRTSLIDYPEKITAVVFTGGCNFRCHFCYNPELVLPELLKDHTPISEKDFFDFLKKREGLLEGVVIGGGEPTLQEDLPEFCSRIKKLGFLVKLDTNGSNPDMLLRLIEEKLLDYVAMDIKAPKEKYMEVIGLEGTSSFYLLEKIQQSIDILKEGNIEYEFRTTVVPYLLDKKDIIKIANWIAPAKRYYLQNFKREKTINPRFTKVAPYDSSYLVEVKDKISPLFEVCAIRDY